MSHQRVAVLTFLLVACAPCFAHRLDEYLQATILSVEKGRVDGSVRLVPGVAVVPAVLASIDTDGNGVISRAEQQAYANRVLDDLSLTIAGKHLVPRLISVDFPTIGQINEGLGQIEIQFSADLPKGGLQQKLVLENHHRKPISVYLMNCLIPQDRRIQIVAQNRNQNQSRYELSFALTDLRSTPPLSPNVGVASIFRLGIRHIAEGTDHLLFLLTLLLPAPLTVFRSRWSAPADARHSLFQILKVVTAFTLGHSITLAIAGLGWLRVPQRPIEVLIAVSILISAIHALLPLFPGREAGIAAFFGLVHGLAFATTIAELGLGRWERIVSILAFNLGIETMQLVVIAATMPSLLLLSHTRLYAYLRIGGGLFAGLAAMGWVVERVMMVHTPVDQVVNGIARYSPWVAIALFLISAITWAASKTFLPAEQRNPSCAQAEPV